MKLKTLTGPQISFLCRVYKKVKKSNINHKCSGKYILLNLMQCLFDLIISSHQQSFS